MVPRHQGAQESKGEMVKMQVPRPLRFCLFVCFLIK